MYFNIRLNHILEINPPSLSKRLRHCLIRMQIKGTLFGFKYIKQCGHQTVLIIRKSDVYKEEE